MEKNGQKLMARIHFANSYSLNFRVLELIAEFE